MSLSGRVTSASRLPLVRSTGALVLNTGINGVLGLAYWVLAARLLDPAIVGLGAGGYSAMVFAASIGWIGLQQVLLRYLPTAGRQGARLILAVYAAAMAMAAIAAVAFLVYAANEPSLSYLVAGPVEMIAFVGAVLVWVVFSLQDPALIGLRRAALVPLENLAFGIAKLVLLLLLVGLASPWTIIGSWILGAGWLVIVVSLVIRKAIRDEEAAGTLPPRDRLLRFSVGQHAIAIMGAAPESLVPIIVLLLVGADATAFYVAAWQIAFTIRLIAVNVGSAVTVEGSVEGASHHRLGRQVRWLAPSAIVPAVAVVALFAPLVMRLFGPEYAAGATDLLRLLVLAVLPFAAVTLFVVGERIAERTAVAFVVVTLTAITALGLDLLLLPILGLVGAGWGWLIAQSVGAAVAGLVVWRRRARSPEPDGTALLRDGNT